MPEIKAILFDFGGTLDSDGYDWPVRIYDFISKRTEPGDFQQFLSHVRNAANAMTDMVDTITLDMDQTAVRLCQGIHKQMDDNWSVDDIAEEFIETARKHLARNTEVLARLSVDYRLGCVSNNWGNVAGWCRQYGIARYFDTIIDSTVVQSVKPEPGIFNAALTELNIAAENCAYVGDNFQCDVVGAHDVGMKPIWIKHPEACTSIAGCFVDGRDKIDPTTINPIQIQSLPELTGLLIPR
ncbi:MAG: HAD family hydrolase [Phycisphaerae bacterium]|nr:HAD family hydrolase [Phycisphaerae bacterium]